MRDWHIGELNPLWESVVSTENDVIRCATRESAVDLLLILRDLESRLNAGSAMLAALRRQRDNIDRWRETGIPADAEESETIKDAELQEWSQIMYAKRVADEELRAASFAVVAMWDGPTYALVMKPCIERLREALKATNG